MKIIQKDLVTKFFDHGKKIMNQVKEPQKGLPEKVPII